MCAQGILVPRLVTTFTNPTPVSDEFFASSVAAMGLDRVLIGATRDNVVAANAGAAYLFNTNGALLATFNNPTPEPFDYFGHSVASVGTDRVVIGAFWDNAGATDAGRAYLFDTNGTRLITLPNPAVTSGGRCGYSVMGLGSDRVLVSAIGDNFGAGVATYLFSTNGTLLTTFTNPTPAFTDYFGWTVAAVGTDWVLIGAYGDSTAATSAGAAYLFSTNGTLLTTFTKPMPANNDHFGRSVAALGTDRVLITSPGEGPGPAFQIGGAYLFSTNGTFLTAFTNPTPAAFDNFGYSVAALGTDRVVIGAWQDNTGAMKAGAAYVFSTNGTLLTTITNPTPAVQDNFGFVVAGMGRDRALIGANVDDTGALNAGAAYLYALTGPPLQIAGENGQVVIFWAASATGYQLESAETLTSNWTSVTNVPALHQGTLSVTNEATGPARFYRLSGQ